MLLQLIISLFFLSKIIGTQEVISNENRIIFFKNGKHFENFENIFKYDSQQTHADNIISALRKMHNVKILFNGKCIGTIETITTKQELNDNDIAIPINNSLNNDNQSLIGKIVIFPQYGSMLALSNQEQKLSISRYLAEWKWNDFINGCIKKNEVFLVNKEPQITEKTMYFFLPLQEFQTSNYSYLHFNQNQIKIINAFGTTTHLFFLQKPFFSSQNELNLFCRTLKPKKPVSPKKVEFTLPKDQDFKNQETVSLSETQTTEDEDELNRELNELFPDNKPSFSKLEQTVNLSQQIPFEAAQEHICGGDIAKVIISLPGAVISRLKTSIFMTSHAFVSLFKNRY